MPDRDELEKEEYTQNYLQYRWLDDTRNRLMDRFFVLLVAVFGARLQFSGFFNDHWARLMGLYLFILIASAAWAKSIISFRRQQRGHSLYLGLMRDIIFNSTENKESVLEEPVLMEYQQYVRGKRIYLTKWTDMLVAFMAAASPFLAYDILWTANHHPSWTAIFIVSIAAVIVSAILCYLLFVPWYKYNFKKKINWKQD